MVYCGQFDAVLITIQPEGGESVDQQREWVTEQPRAKRYAEELVALCRLINEGPSEVAVEGEMGSIPRLLSLCNLIDSTEACKEYIRGLLMADGVTVFPQRLLINLEAEEGSALGPFYPKPKDFERMMILIRQPIAIEFALKLGETREVKKLSRRIERWRKQFKIKYKERVEHEVDMVVLKRQFKYLSTPQKKIEEEPSSP